MKKIAGILVFIWVFLISSIAFSQDFRGIWQGYITGAGQSYNTSYTLHVKTQEGGIVSGRAYIFSKKYLIHESSLDFVGDISGGKLRINELVVVKNIVTIRNKFLCIKYADLKLTRRNNIDHLSGFWTNLDESTDCIPGEVYLTRLTTPKADNGDPIPDAVLDAIAQDKSTALTFIGTELTSPIILDVSTRLLTLELRDYLREDNDTVTIYFNRKLLINKLGISKQPYTRTIRLGNQPLNEIILYANNLGQVPPNTSRLSVKDAAKTQRVDIESSKQKSAVIYLRYTPRNSSP